MPLPELFCWNAINITRGDVFFTHRHAVRRGVNRTECAAIIQIYHVACGDFYVRPLNSPLTMVFCVGCGCDVDGKEKKHRLLLSSPDVNHELYSLWEECFHKAILKSGRESDLGDFQEYLRSERAYLCRPCRDLFFKLSSIQNKLAERITKAVAAIEGCIEVNNNGSRK